MTFCKVAHDIALLCGSKKQIKKKNIDAEEILKAFSEHDFVTVRGEQWELWQVTDNLGSDELAQAAHELASDENPNAITELYVLRIKEMLSC